MSHFCAQIAIIFAVYTKSNLKYLLHLENYFFAFLTVLHLQMGWYERGQSDAVQCRAEGCVFHITDSPLQCNDDIIR